MTRVEATDLQYLVNPCYHSKVLNRRDDKNAPVTKEVRRHIKRYASRCLRDEKVPANVRAAWDAFAYQCFCTIEDTAAESSDAYEISAPAQKSECPKDDSRVIICQVQPKTTLSSFVVKTD